MHQRRRLLANQKVFNPLPTRRRWLAARVQLPAGRPIRVPGIAKQRLHWRISRIRGNRAEVVGVVLAPNEVAAVKVAIDANRISDPDNQRRLFARPEDR